MRIKSNVCFLSMWLKVHMLRRPYFLCSWHRADAILIGIIAEVLRNELQIKDSELQIFNCDLEMVSGQDSWSGPSPNLYGWCLLWYWCTCRSWMLNLWQRFWMLDNVTFLGTGHMLINNSTFLNLHSWFNNNINESQR